MVRVYSVDCITISTLLGYSYDLYQKTWYISATLLTLIKDIRRCWWVYGGSFYEKSVCVLIIFVLFHLWRG